MAINEELKRSNFERSARRYMQESGLDEQAGDYEAYFDPTLTQHENMSIFKEAHPGPTSGNSYQAKYEREQASKYRLEALKDELEYKKQEKERMKEEKRAFAEEQIRKGKEPGPLDFAMEDIETEAKNRKPSLFDKAQGLYSNLKSKYNEHQETSLKEREFRAKQKYAKYQKEEQIRQLEARSGPSAGSRIMAGLSSFAGKRSASGGYDRGLLGESLRGGKTSGLSLLTSGHNPGSLYSMISGSQGAPQGKPRNKYITVIEKGIARRVKVPVEGQAPAMNQPQRGALESHIYGNQDKSPLFGMIGGSNPQKSGLSGLIGSKNTGFYGNRGKSGSGLGFNTSRKSALSPGMGKSRLSMLSGKKKTIWRV